MTTVDPTQPAHLLDYVNHRGERATRRVEPRRVWFGNTDWHEDEQWLVECYDFDREAIRNYAVSEIQHWDGLRDDVRPGVYRHFKGDLYLVVGMVRYSESEELLVRYRKLGGTFDEWVRPLAMFVQKVEVDGESRARFEYLGYGKGGQQAGPHVD